MTVASSNRTDMLMESDVEHSHNFPTLFNTATISYQK